MRETRSYGSARGVRSNPYPYRDIPTPRAQHGKILNLTPAAHLRQAGQPNLTSGSTRAQPLPVAESPHHQLRNQPRNRDRSRQLNRTRIMARMRKR